MHIAPTLYILCDQKEINVADVKGGDVQITFRRRLTEELQLCWDGIMTDVDRYQLQDSEDLVVWQIGKTKKFSVKSLYNALTQTDAGSDHRRIWKGRVPPKIKIYVAVMQ